MKMFFERTSSIQLSSLIPKYTNIIDILFQAIEMSQSIDTLILNCDSSEITNSLEKFINRTHNIKTLDFDFSTKESLADFPKIVNGILHNSNKSIQNIQFNNIKVSTKVFPILQILFNEHPFNSLKLTRSLSSKDYVQFLHMMNETRYFHKLNTFQIDSIIYNNDQILIDPYLFFQVSKGIPNIGLSNSFLYIQSLPYIFEDLPQEVTNNKGKGLSLNLSLLDAEFDVKEPFFITANVTELIFKDILITSRNFLFLLFIITQYRTNDLSVDFSSFLLTKDIYDDIDRYEFLWAKIVSF